MKMKVKKVVGYVNSSSEAADVTVTDGQFELTCFCWPCTLTEGQEIAEPLSGMLTDYKDCPDCTLKYAMCILSKKYEDIQKADNEVYEIKKLTGSYCYHLTGKVVDQLNGIIAIGGLLIEVEDIPHHKEGEFVTFHCMQINIAW